MSSSFVKGKLKASREAIQAKEWDRALEEAGQVLEYEADNYNAHVFRGLALLQLKRHGESEEAYRAAIKSQPSQLLAWQGLQKFYTETRAWTSLADVLQKQMDLAMDSDEVIKCAEALQQLVSLQREEGARSQLASALSHYLPSSPYHSLLSRLPLPDQSNPHATTTFAAEMAIHIESLLVVKEIISLTEEVEKDAVEREVEKRRTRLDSASKSREALRNEIGVEIWKDSKLPDLYEQVLSHVNASDDERREAEHKLLLYRYKYLRALPNPAASVIGPGSTAVKKDSAEVAEAGWREKVEARESVRSLAAGIVAIDVPDELAWTTLLEWDNLFSPVELKGLQVRTFVNHFPRSGLSQSFRALLYTVQDEQFLKEENDRFEEQDRDVPRPDPLSLAIAGVEDASESILAHRIAASLYLLDRDWPSCCDLATTGLEKARRLEVNFAVDLSLAKAGLESFLASALTHLHPPQHHPRALRLSDSVLSQESDCLDALLCKGYIAQSAGRWEQARSLFANVATLYQRDSASKRTKDLQRLSISRNPEREARLEVAWCDIKLGRLEQGKEQLEEAIHDLDESQDADGNDQAKAWWRLGTCLWEMGGTHREEVSGAFTCFITALKRDSSYAPAFTSLGFYYLTVPRPAESARSLLCFQKAFELDPTENEAGRRLAQSYADQEEWDLVYLVAHRTIEGEGGGHALNGEVISQRRHVTRNPWAWTAIGSSELMRGNVEKSIIAFQIALRSFSGNGNIWMQLGEAYVASGRFTAAIKAFERAQSLLGESKEAWQPLFSIASVQRQQGRFEEAMAILESLWKREPERVGIKAACAETRLSLALEQIRHGYSSRARASIAEAIDEARLVLERDESMLAAWKVIADGLLCSYTLRLELDNGPVEEVMEGVRQMARQYNVDASLPSISAVTEDRVTAATGTKERVLLMAVYLCKLRVLLHHNDEQVAGSAWMDLTVALHSLSREQQGEQGEQRDSHSQAIACAKEALKLEPGNGTYWSTLGDLVFVSSVKLAQHCYIKSIESDASKTMPWTNLGFLYLDNGDVGLAKECFVKAQTLEPDYVQAWIGQAMAAKSQGRQDTSRSLFQHAYAINEGSHLEAAYGFASSLFQAQSSRRNASMPSLAQLHSASFALSSYLAHRPQDVSALHLSALYAEQLGQLETAMERIERASSILEEQYERDESAEKARLFAVCMANLGRIRMAHGDHGGAKEAFDMCLALLDTEDDESDSSNGALVLAEADLKRAGVGAHCGGGMAQYALGECKEAIESLRLALEEESDREGSSKEQLYVLLAQMVWSSSEKGSDREEAERTAMEAISLYPNSIPALFTLGAMSIVKGDEEQLALVQSELQTLLDADRSPSSVAVAFLVIIQLLHGHVEAAIELLQSRTAASFGAHWQLVVLLLRRAIQARKDGGHSSVDEAVVARKEAMSMYERVQNNVAEAGQQWLIPSTLCLTVASALQGSREEAIQMALRIVNLQPGKPANPSLLQTILTMSEQQHPVTIVS